MTHTAAATQRCNSPAVGHESRRRGSAHDIIHTSTAPAMVVPAQAVAG
jgi:hypothetical protein